MKQIYGINKNHEKVKIFVDKDGVVRNLETGESEVVWNLHEIDEPN